METLVEAIAEKLSLLFDRVEVGSGGRAMEVHIGHRGDFYIHLCREYPSSLQDEERSAYTTAEVSLIVRNIINKIEEG